MLQMYMPPTQSAMAHKEAPMTHLVMHLLSGKAPKSPIKPWANQGATASSEQSEGGQDLSPLLSVFDLLIDEEKAI